MPPMVHCSPRKIECSFHSASAGCERKHACIGMSSLTTISSRQTGWLMAPRAWHMTATTVICIGFPLMCRAEAVRFIVRRLSSPSVAFENLGARIDPAGVRNDQRPILRLQERSPDLTRPHVEVPQAVKLLDGDVHDSASHSRAVEPLNAFAASACADFSARRS